MVLALLTDEDIADFRIDVCLLEDLMTTGPFAPIVCSARAPGRCVDWFGRGA